MDGSDGTEKSWDHPWTTDEMRENRREWSLAGDAGLLKYLQQFSENLIARTRKTEEALGTLTTHLKETSILLDNVTNTSLALANTQFIESRVQEDDIEIEKKTDDSEQEVKDQDSLTADLIATVSESIRDGLNLMDERYRRMEVVDSDSEEEDEAIVLSVILGPNNPYQDRPLPYVIGTEKWKNSSKIGLESSSSSSSESEQAEDEEDELVIEKGGTAPSRQVFDAPNIKVARRSSSSSSSSSSSASSTSSRSDRYDQRNNVPYVNNGKVDGVITRTSMNSHSESITPVDNISKAPLPSVPTPSFAEELAKRLGTVRQDQKQQAPLDEKSEASINRHKEDLFTAEDDDAFDVNKPDDIFGEAGGKPPPPPPPKDQTSASLWKERPIETYKSNIIPASIDVPPPISTVSTKPKSAIDDLFADAESDDSDDIFSPRNAVKKVTKEAQKPSTTGPTGRHLDAVAPSVTGNMATSTPETDARAASLFSDEDDDDGYLFGTAKKPTQGPLSNKKKSAMLTAELEKKLSSRAPREAESTGSTGSTDTPANPAQERVPNAFRNVQVNVEGPSPIVAARNNADNLAGTIESSSSSGISIRPPSINYTGGSSSIGADFQPQLTSTRRRSEEIYRERIASDSLFAARTRNPVEVSNSQVQDQQQQQQQQQVQYEGSTSRQADDVFENEDLFGPPPLPKASSRTKSKVSSLFDDSDSGDELFSTTSSGSRSQKSTDLLVATAQNPERKQRRGLFDEEVDIFAAKDSPDVDIFGIAGKPGPSTRKTDLFGSKEVKEVKQVKEVKEVKEAKDKKKISLFDDEDDEDEADLFGGRGAKTEFKVETNLFKDDEDEDLFASRGSKPSSSAEKGVSSIEPGSANVVTDQITGRKPERKPSDILSGNGLFSTAVGSHGLVFEDDDYDDLFASKSTTSQDGDHDKAVVATAVSEPESEKERTPCEGREGFDKVSDLKEFSDPRNESPETETAERIEEAKEHKGTAVETVQVDEDQGFSKESLLGPSMSQQVFNQRVETKKENVEAVVEESSKKSPPKTLNIRPDSSLVQTGLSSSPPAVEESGQPPKRTVSGKIKNLMGKMGELKILSPMDTPPPWRKSEERTDEEEEEDRDSEDGGCLSTQAPGSPVSVSGHSAESSAPRKQPSLQSTASGGSNFETAISFDEPVQVETLSTAASKTRVRIQAKRRPQSRHARKSALRHSGIDFDTVDASEGTSQEDSLPFSGTYSSSNNMNNSSNEDKMRPGSDRVRSGIERQGQRAEPITAAADDRSEPGSLSKESSMSANNKNTLLSPSTDEEDLFDVPPDLPEDPQKEDPLFGRAPILSPVESLISDKVHRAGSFKPLRDTVIRTTEDHETVVQTTVVPQDIEGCPPEAQPVPKTPEKKNAGGSNKGDQDEEPGKGMVDPLRDSSHDPLKDPSQLFAFVTKTPSPEKGKSLLFAEDDSLFTSSARPREVAGPAKRQLLDLFADDADGGDLFSGPLAKPVLKKPLKETRIGLFEDVLHDQDHEKEEDALFGSVRQPKPRRAPNTAEEKPRPSLFDDNDDENENDASLFSELSEDKSQMSTSESSVKNEPEGKTSRPAVKSIFDDQPGHDMDDIFSTKPVRPKKATASKLFPSDDDEDQGEEQAEEVPEQRVLTKSGPDLARRSTESSRPSKKPVTRDLKKTAEKISQDPLSIFRDD